MKLNLDKRYMKFCKYIILTAVIIYLLFTVIDWIPSIYDNALEFLGAVLDISFPIILGFIIAYLLFGPMNFIENFLMSRKHFPHKKSFCRIIGMIISYLCLIGIILFLIVGIYFMIGGQLSNSSTVTNIINYVSVYFTDNTLSANTIQEFISQKNIPFGDMIIGQLDNIANFIQGLIISLIDGVASFILALGSNIFSLLISIILSVYVLFSHEYFIGIWDKFFFIIFRNTKSGNIIKRSLHNINVTFSKYIRGQLIEASIVAILSSIVLLIVGVDYAVVIGIIAGVCNLIPYIGPFVGTVLAAIVALFSGSIWTVIGSIIGLFIVQQIDSNILCPKIVGDIVGLHPGLIIIAITVGGNLAGLFGMLIAVPVTASAKIIVTDWFNYYFKERYEKYRSDSDLSSADRGKKVHSFSDEKDSEPKKENENDTNEK